MPYRSRKPASTGKTIALALRETVFTAAWGLLGGAVLLPFIDMWYMGIPPAMIASALALAYWEVKGASGPLVALELRQFSSNGRREDNPWKTFTRILLSVILLPAAGIGYLPMLFGLRSLPEIVSFTRIRETDRRLDPRPREEIDRTVNAAANRFKLILAAPLVASGVMLFLHHSAPDVISVQAEEPEHSLPESERLLLAEYLELSVLHPEELEYHVRLASLYYRNGMDRDLRTELEIIASIDPGHAILLLGDTMDITFENLLPDTDENPEHPDSTITLVQPTEPVETDTLESDSLQQDPDAIPEDTLETAALHDSLAPAPMDTTVTGTDEETDWLDTTEVETVETDTIEPDTLVQP